MNSFVRRAQHTLASIFAIGSQLNFQSSRQLLGVLLASTLFANAMLIGPLLADQPMRLQLKDGSFSVGKVVPNVLEGCLGWKADGFAVPFQYDLGSVRSVGAIADAAEDDPAVEGYFVELRDGSKVAGQLLELNEKEILLESPILGKVRLDRSMAMTLVDGRYAGELLYSGAFNRETWRPLGDKDTWDYSAVGLIAKGQGARVLGDVKLPEKAQINLVLTWKGVADFVFWLGVPDLQRGNAQQGQPSIYASARIEVWGTDLALVREVPGNADLVMLSELSGAIPRVELNIYMDQVEGIVIVCDSHGRPLERLEAKSSERFVQQFVSVANHGPSLCLERFEVREWDGHTAFPGDDANSGSILLSGDERLSGSILNLDPETQEFAIRLNGENAAEKRPVDDILRATIWNPQPASDDAKDLGAAEPASLAQRPAETQPPPVTQPPQLGEDVPAQSADAMASESGADLPISGLKQNKRDAKMDAIPIEAEVVFLDRSRIRGKWLASQDGNLRLQTDGVSSYLKKGVEFTPESMRGIIGTNNRYVVDETLHRSGTLKLDETQSDGYLVENTPDGSSVALYWHPHSSRNASPIEESAAGAIIYRRTIPRLTTPLGGKVKSLNRVLTFQEKRSAPRSPPNAGEAKETQFEMIFRSGDAIDGFVSGIDEQGIHFQSSHTSTVFATQDQLQSVMLNPTSRDAKFPQKMVDRLMTVPRSMKSDPPTHLLVSIYGDYLRGRLVSLDKEFAVIEVRLEMQKIPRQHVAKIVWLHDRTWEEQSEKKSPTADEGKFSVHGISADDRGLTFHPQNVTNGTISGVSSLLGKCSFHVKELNQLLFGRDISRRIREYADNPWSLSLAKLPKVFQPKDKSASPSGRGTDSPLVGKPAPGFKLRTLDNTTIDLESLRGQVVVLDFWASWCGPCMQTMPKLEEAVSAFDDVKLVAVNIQESRPKVAAAVDKLALNATVVLDASGVVASEYEARAIPQTVIIDRDGNVKHVFIGGGNQMLKQFKSALEELTAN